MNARLSALLVSMLFSFATTACGGDGPSTGGDGGVSNGGDGGASNGDSAVSQSELRRLTDRYLAAVCAQLERCPADQIEWYDPANCIADARDAYEAKVRSIELLLSEGRVALSSGESEACIARVSSMSCGSLFHGCLILEGRLAVGAPCDLQDECSDGYCEGQEPGVCGSGRCTAYAKSGESCETVRCAEGLYCASSASGDVCAPEGRLGDACTSSWSCEEGSFCEIEEGADAGTCVQFARVTVGEDCSDPHVTCAGLSLCENDVCMPPRTDGTCRFQGGNWTDIDCPAGQYCDGATRDSDGECRPKPGDGEACKFRDIPCAIGFVCTMADVCAPARTLGESCETNEQCAFSYCEGTSRVCTLIPSCGVAEGG